MNPMNDPVYRAATLCDLKGKTTYAEIATVAGINRQKAIEYILRNDHILRKDKRGNVLGFLTHEANVQRTVAAIFHPRKEKHETHQAVGRHQCCQEES